jgi:hypothetical protein
MPRAVRAARYNQGVDATFWAITLTVIGGGFELGGLWLVAREIATDRARARELFHRTTQSITAGGASASVLVGGGDATVTGGPEPTVEERVERLEHELRAVREAFDRKLADLRAELEQEITSDVAEARAATGEVTEKIWGAIQEMLEGGLGRRGVGVGLFAAGLILSVIGNVIGALAP